MAIKLGANNYGKSGVRLLRVVKQQGRHDIKELTIRLRFEGDFETAHTKGDNQKILPTDTMKNTVYVLARQYPVEAVEEFALHLIEHFLTYNPQVSRVRIEASENLWERLILGGKPHSSAFTRAGDEKRTAAVDRYPRRNHHSRGHRRFDRIEDHQVCVRRISPRPLHDPQGRSRSHFINGDSRGLAL